MGPRSKTAQADADDVCDCDPRQGQFCDDPSVCINRSTLSECGAACAAGELCTNQQLQRGAQAPVVVAPAQGRGFGLFASGSIRPGQLIAEYFGEVITEQAAARREKARVRSGDSSTYIMGLDRGRVLDARLKGGVARFANHSCAPNATAQKWRVAGESRVGIFAARAIAASQARQEKEQVAEQRHAKRVQARANPMVLILGFLAVFGVLGLLTWFFIKSVECDPMITDRGSSAQCTRAPH